MRFVALFAIVGLMGAPLALGQEQFDIVGSLLLPAAAPDTIIIASEITVATPLDLKRALQRRPGATTIELASDGGSVYGALVMAVEIHERGLNTHIPAGFGCYSACAFLYLAGVRREMDGELGVHQISTEGIDLGAEAAQFTVADIIETISSFGVSPGVITAMLRTPADEIYVFSEAEVTTLSLERMAATVDELATPSLPEPPAPVANVPTAAVDPTALTVISKTTDASEAGFGQSERVLTLLESTTVIYVLSRNGFTDAMINAIEAALLGVTSDGTLAAGTHMRILFGPSRTSNSLIPYRLSIYAPEDASGIAAHSATVALTDRGQYVLGLAPPSIQFGEVTLGTPPRVSPADISPLGKSSRYPLAGTGN